MSVSVQYPIPLVYKGIHLEAGYRADLVVDDTVVVALKSVDSISSLHAAQMLTYLEAFAKPVGLLINFNVPVLRDGVKRLLNPEMLKRGSGTSEGGDSSRKVP